MIEIVTWNMLRVILIVTRLIIALVVAWLIVGRVVGLVEPVVIVLLAIVIIWIGFVHLLHVVNYRTSSRHLCSVDDHGLSEEGGSPPAAEEDEEEEEDEEDDDTDGPIDPGVAVVVVLAVV